MANFKITVCAIIVCIICSAVAKDISKEYNKSPRSEKSLFLGGVIKGGYPGNPGYGGSVPSRHYCNHHEYEFPYYNQQYPGIYNQRYPGRQNEY